jgi:signal transduction histidine kinase
MMDVCFIEPVSNGGSDLRNLRELMEQTGGNFQISSSKGKGTQITARLPSSIEHETRI